MRKFSTLARVCATIALVLCAVRAAGATELTVMISGGYAAALTQLAPAYATVSGDTIVMLRGPSMGDTRDAIPARLARGEKADLIIMVGSALESLIKNGTVAADSRVDLARSAIGLAVRAGTPKPDISTVEAFRRALLAAKSIAYSDSASGVYLQNELFPRLGLSEALKAKSTMIPAVPVASIVAKGDAELGFQQISELLPVPGVDVVGPIPAELQKITLFSAGIPAGAARAAAARALLAFLATPEAVRVVRGTGLEPIAR